MSELLNQLLATLNRGLACVYCSVVATRGSTPQKAGASMLVFADGTQAGTLGGGCVEAEVKRQVLHALQNGSGPAVSTFLLDDDYGWDDGLICGGRMTILCHPLRPQSVAIDLAINYFQTMLELVQAGRGFTEATVVEESAGLPIGDRYLISSSGERVACLASHPDWNAVLLSLDSLIHRPRPTIREGIAFLPASPRITLLLVGGGHVSQAVSRLAVDLDFRVWVLDDRERYANAERFPGAERLIVGDIGRTLQELVPRLPETTFALILTRGHNHDEEALYHLARSRCGYVGMIGSKRKVRLIFDDLIAKGVSAEDLRRVRSPIGIDIGSQSVPEIAVSIIAEVIACRNLGAVTKAEACE